MQLQMCVFKIHEYSYHPRARAARVRRWDLAHSPAGRDLRWRKSPRDHKAESCPNLKCKEKYRFYRRVATVRLHMRTTPRITGQNAECRMRYTRFQIFPEEADGHGKWWTFMKKKVDRPGETWTILGGGPLWEEVDHHGGGQQLVSGGASWG